jgi:hypothetical protein
MTLLESSDQNKYGSLLQVRSTTFSLGTDSYPRSKEKALDALSNHKFDGRYYEVQKKTRDKMQTRTSDKKSDEDEDGASDKTFSQRPKDSMTCYCCGKSTQHPNAGIEM